jgi:prolyl oligopeptidase
MARSAIAFILMIGCSGANREVVTDELFGIKVADPHRWLENEEDAEVKAWMQAKNAEARAYLEKLPAREALEKRLEELVYVEARGAPIERGGRLFYWKKGARQEKAVHYVKAPDAEERVLLDPNTMSADGSISVGYVVPSHDGKLVAYTTSMKNADESDLHVMEVDTKKELDVVKGVRYTSPSWTPDNRGFFYTWIPNDPAIPESERMGYGEVRYRSIAEHQDETYREKTGDPTRWQGASVSKDGKYLFLSISHGWSETDVYVMFLAEKERRWRELAVGTKAIYNVEAYGDVFYVHTNRDAPRYQVFAVRPDRLDEWQKLIPEDPEAVIDEIDIVGGKLGVRYLKNASSELAVFELDGKKTRTVPLPSIGTTSGLIGDQDSDTAYFGFSSYAHPPQIYRTAISTGETELFAKVDVPIDPDAFEVKQVWYPSKDGTKVSMFIIHKKGLALDGTNPAVLYGYGGFNIALTPDFNPARIPWLERGGVWAIPNLRGGGEYGEAWHQAGMKANKQNVFDDFIAAAEYLVEQKYTSRERLAISGRSNGGLLVGAAMTQRPELFSAVICGVPLLDMVRYHLVGIGRAWIPEYGSPEVKEEFEILLGYSPYHKVKEGTPYPALLMLSADADDRVDPMHARKFHAAIADASKSEEPNLLRIEMNSGHGGADLRKSFVDQTVDELSFLLSETSR